MISAGVIILGLLTLVAAIVHHVPEGITVVGSVAVLLLGAADLFIDRRKHQQ